MTRPMPVRALSIVAMTILFGMSFGGSSYADLDDTGALSDSCEIDGDGICFFTCTAGVFIKAKSDNGPGVTVAECGGAAAVAVSFFAGRENDSPTPPRIDGSGTCTHTGIGDGKCTG